MFGSDILDTAVGLFLTYFLFSALCSALNEWIVGHAFRWRAEILERTLARMLGDPATAKEFLAQPLIRSLSQDDNTKPSYLSDSMFIDGLVALVKAKAAQVQPALDPAILGAMSKDPQKLLAALEKINNPSLQPIVRGLLDGIQDIEEARKKLETWFNECMDRATGWYKRHVQVCMIFLAVVVAVVFNVDTFTIARTLLSDSKLRATLAAVAEATVKETTSSPTNTGPSIGAIEQQVRSLDLPIGWPNVANASKENPHWILGTVYMAN